MEDLPQGCPITERLGREVSLRAGPPVAGQTGSFFYGEESSVSGQISLPFPVLPGLSFAHDRWTLVQAAGTVASLALDLFEQLTLGCCLTETGRVAYKAPTLFPLAGPQ
jgi:hypothetical protein